MDRLIQEIIEEPLPAKPKLLPPIFGGKPPKNRKHPKKRVSNKQRFKILYDSELRSKASSVLNPVPPKDLKSVFKTSRLTKLSLNFIKNLRDKSFRSNINFPSSVSIHQSLNFSNDYSRYLRESTFHLPAINKSTVINVDFKDDGLFLSGNKKEILGRCDYNKLTDEIKKKVHREIALGTDLMTEGSDKMSTGNNTISEFLKPNDKSNMRKSSFHYKQDL